MTSSSPASAPFQAGFFRSVDDVILRENRFDRVQPSEKIIAIDACGICGTDINAILLGAPDYTPLGHEVAGRVVKDDGAPFGHAGGAGKFQRVRSVPHLPQWPH